MTCLYRQVYTNVYKDYFETFKNIIKYPREWHMPPSGIAPLIQDFIAEMNAPLKERV